MNVELVPKGDAPKAAEMELKGDEMNLEYYEGDELEARSSTSSEEVI
jgi:hypothetical protein